MRLKMLDLEKHLIIIITVFSLGMPNGSVKEGGPCGNVNIHFIYINRGIWSCSSPLKCHRTEPNSSSPTCAPMWAEGCMRSCSPCAGGREGGWRGGDSCAVRCDHPTGVYETRPGGCQVIQTPKHKHTYKGLSLPDSGCLLCVSRSHFCLIHYLLLDVSDSVLINMMECTTSGLIGGSISCISRGWCFMAVLSFLPKV